SLFFFQAEDGIRDIGVTGVQTCALPISPMIARPSPVARRSAGVGSGGLRIRSEERRVGKGVDLGGRRIIKKKKQARKKSMAMVMCAVSMNSEGKHGAC